jgi:hypothetical protein
MILFFAVYLKKHFSIICEGSSLLVMRCLERKKAHHKRGAFVLINNTNRILQTRM